MDLSFQGKRVIVTGAGSGIGRSIAKALAGLGAEVYGVSILQSELDSLKGECPAIHTVCVDISAWSACQAAITSIGPVDHLVNCAGIFAMHSLLDITESDLEAVLGVHVKGTLAVSQIVAQMMIEHKINGSILSISSVASQRALGALGYCAAKGALDQLTRCMAVELGPYQIRVNAIQPTGVDTPLYQQAIELVGAETLNDIIERTPLKRNAEVSEVTNAALYLLSDKADMITGAFLPVDGGFLCT